MKFGLYGLHKGDNIAPEALARRARLAEAAGFDSLWVGDHIALPAELDGADEARLEAVVALGYLAAVTKSVRLVLGVLVLPQRQPVLVAKQISSVDTLSDGRLTVGVGVGYLEAELKALGATLADRGARTDEHLNAMVALWGEPAASFEGRTTSFADVIERPLPVQRPHPPLVVGGHSEAALRRAQRVASGWYGWELAPEEAADAVGRLREAGAELEITVTPHSDVDLELARRYAEAGVDRLVLQPSTSDGAAMDELIALARDELIGKI